MRPPVDVVRGVEGGVVVVVVVIVEDPEEGEGAAVFNAMCRAAFDVLFSSPRRVVMEIDIHSV